MGTGSLLGIKTRHGLMPAYAGVPDTAAPWPGVVVIHDFTGVSQDLRSHADWLAGEGFLAIEPDLYYLGSRLPCLRRMMRELGTRRPAPGATRRPPWMPVDASRCSSTNTSEGTHLVGMTGHSRARLVAKCHP